MGRPLGTLAFLFNVSHRTKGQNLATIAQVFEQHELIGNLVGRELRARYKQATLGILWSILMPLANTLLFTFVFGTIAGLHAPPGADGRPIPYLLYVNTGTIFWAFFASGVSSGAESLISNSGLLTKVYFPREVFPITTLTARAMDAGFSLILFVGIALCYGLAGHFHLTWGVLLVPFVLLIQFCLMLGLALLLSTVNLFNRDVRFVLPLFIQVWSFLTPVSYPLTRFISGTHKHPLVAWMYLHLNPMTPLILAYQKLILNEQLPPGLALGPMVAASAVVSVLVLLAGYAVFIKYEESFAEAV